MNKIIVKEDEYFTSDLVTKEEWLEILSDDSLMSNNYKYALSIFYLEPEHRSSCKHLGKKYNIHYNSINSYIMNFSKAVQKKLNRFELIHNGGNAQYWPITMKGRNIDGGLFEWQLREELIDAMLDLDYVNASAITIKNLKNLIDLVNKDVGDFKKTFAKARKALVNNLKNSPNSTVLFYYKKEDRDWSINYGGSDEIQYHLYLRANKVGFGLGVNTQSMRSEIPALESAKPYLKALISLKDSDYLNKLINQGFVWENEISSAKDIRPDNYYLLEKIISLRNNKISLIDYYTIINNLKGDLFEAYKKIFSLANEISNDGKPNKQDIDMILTNPLMQEVGELLLANINLVLTGAPGTGKTYLAKQLAES
ncbi:hypothetical protein [Psychrobacter sp.]|uniref:hypothetical protein n=1 Tax=Psychrobacter sp. TaxID=56811 RepID=UPI0025EE9662|nr:hypothetical protein [Psychrobacter sp.]